MFLATGSRFVNQTNVCHEKAEAFVRNLGSFRFSLEGGIGGGVKPSEHTEIVIGSVMQTPTEIMHAKRDIYHGTTQQTNGEGPWFSFGAGADVSLVCEHVSDRPPYDLRYNNAAVTKPLVCDPFAAEVTSSHTWFLFHHTKLFSTKGLEKSLRDLIRTTSPCWP